MVLFWIIPHIKSSLWINSHDIPLLLDHHLSTAEGSQNLQDQIHDGNQVNPDMSQQNQAENPQGK